MEHYNVSTDGKHPCRKSCSCPCPAQGRFVAPMNGTSVATQRWRRAKIHPLPDNSPFMTTPKYDYRQFQEELARLESKVESKVEKQPPSKPLGKKAAAAQRLATARDEFLTLRKRHDLSVADVVAFFPEEEGVAYLQQLIVAAQAKPRRTRKPKD